MKLLRNIANQWFSGMVYTIYGDTTSYFTYVTLILCEILFIHINVTTKTGKCLMLMSALHIVNLLMGAYLKSRSIDFEDKKVCSNAIIIAFIIITIASLICSVKFTLLFSTISIGYTALSNKVRKLFIKLLEDPNSNVFLYFGANVLDKVLRAVVPIALFIALIILWCHPIQWALSIILAFILFMPFLNYIENSVSKEDIFELIAIKKNKE